MPKYSRRHYRIAKKNINENPNEGIFVTREEQTKHFLFILTLILVSFLSIIPLYIKRK